MDPSKNPNPNEEEQHDTMERDEDDWQEDIEDVLMGRDGQREDAFELDELLGGNSPVPLDVRNFDEHDYRWHRRETVPHARRHHGSPRRRTSSTRTGQGTREADSDLAVAIPSEDHGLDDLDILDSPVKKVQFEIGEINSPQDDHRHHEKKKHRKQYHHHHHEDSGHGIHSGVPKDQLLSPGYILVEMDSMEDLDQENISDHRFSDQKGYRRHRVAAKLVGHVEQGTPLKQPKYDHRPHEIFVELDVLSGHGEQREWKEAARWIKYEEDVLEGSDRWGRPHVASLSFHSLINLRRLLETGVTLLDLEERELPGVAYRVVDELIRYDLIKDEDRITVMRSLLLKHKHVGENEWVWKFNLRRNTTSDSLNSLQAIIEQEKHRQQSHNNSMGSPNTVPDNLNGVGVGIIAGNKNMQRRNSAVSRLVSDHGRHDREGEDGTSQALSHHSDSGLSEEDLARFSKKEDILRRIPAGAEASVVLVGRDDRLKQPIMAFVRLAESAFMPSVTEVPIPVRFIFVLLGPSTYDLDYKEIGRSIATLMSNRQFHEIAYKAEDRRDMLHGIHEFLDESLVLPPGDWDSDLLPFEEMKQKRKNLRKRKEKEKDGHGSYIDTGKEGMVLDDGTSPPDGFGPGRDNPFKRSRRMFGGLVNDVKRRYRHYLTDFRDGLNFQVLASIIFIYFACVSGAIAFGGILSERTEKHIGISETLIATSAAGFVFALCAGQPLIILGTTGPLLLFDQSLYTLCQQNEIDFLGIRFWIGLWVAIIGMIVVMVDGSVIAKYFTRYIQEIFSGLISLIFISDAVSNIIKVYQNHPLQQNYDQCTNCTNSQPLKLSPRPNTALLSTLLTVGTFGVAFTLRIIRNSTFFTPTIRKLLGSFAVPIAIVCIVGTDYLLRELIHTEKLNVPDGLTTTNERYSWFVIPVGQIGIIFLAIVPAMLLFILIFMETSICALLIGKKEMKLRKGGGYHLDIFLLCLINGGLGTIGGCWVCAATVRAITHASSLLVFSTNNPPGEKPRVIGVKEQRVSNLIISILLGVSVLMSPILVLIPMAVLFGVFLYMGISSISGVQLFERCTLFLKQVRNHPQVPYVTRVKTSKMYLYTMIQLICLSTLFIVKYTPAALAIPFLLILLVPMRFLMLPKIFKPEELEALDGTGEEEDDEDSRKPSVDKLPLVNGKDKKTNNRHIQGHEKHSLINSDSVDEHESNVALGKGERKVHLV